MKKVLLFVVILNFTTNIKAESVIDDFEDGEINPNIWCTVQGTLYPGYEEQAWGEVCEENGQLVLTSFDHYDPMMPHGGGVASAVLKQIYLDVPVSFSFEATLYDSNPEASYSPHIEFLILDNNNIDNWFGQGFAGKIVYAIEHDQVNTTTQVSGEYYYYFDSSLKEARMYDASNDALLASVNYSDFTGGPYICFETYTDTDNGDIEETLRISEITVIPEPATMSLLTVAGLAMLRRRKIS